MDMTLSLVYLPSAVALGALHALEPGHAKTLTAAYLIGIRGTKWDAVVLGLSVALTHSLVVVLLALLAVWAGRETFTGQAMFGLQLASGILVAGLGTWMLWRRMKQARIYSNRVDHAYAGPSSETPADALALGHSHPHPHAQEHAQEHAHDHAHVHAHEHNPASQSGHAPGSPHDLLDDDEHARAHAADLPEYARRGERPTLAQIVAFGAAGGLLPCPASVTVMLLALSVSQASVGLLLVLGFSLGLALTLVLVGLAVVAGLSKLSASGRFAWVSRKAPIFSAVMVLFSGLFALLAAAFGS